MDRITPRSVEPARLWTLALGLWTLDSLVRANHQKIEAIIDRFQGRAFDAHYLSYFECFNQQLYFEAHEVLERLWLAERGRPLDLFYKGLIQFAGAFVHLQRRRPRPAIALFELARRNLRLYPRFTQGLDLKGVLDTINRYVEELSNADKFSPESAPKVLLAEPCESCRQSDPADPN